MTEVFPLPTSSPITTQLALDSSPHHLSEITVSEALDTSLDNSNIIESPTETSSLQTQSITTQLLYMTGKKGGDYESNIGTSTEDQISMGVSQEVSSVNHLTSAFFIKKDEQELHTEVMSPFPFTQTFIPMTHFQDTTEHSILQKTSTIHTDTPKLISEST